MAEFAVGLDQHMASSASCLRVARLAMAWSWLHSSPLDLGRTIVVADFHPPKSMLLNCLGALPRYMTLPFIPQDPLPGVAYFLLNLDANPMTWSNQAAGTLPEDIDTVASLLRWELVTGKTMQNWSRMKIKHVWFLRENAKVGIPPLLGAAGKAVAKLARKVSSGSETSYHDKTKDFLAAMPGRGTIRRGDKLRIAHYTWSLDSGGAERQMCNTAIAQKRDGHDVRVFLVRSPVAQSGHYLPLLEKAGIAARAAGTQMSDEVRRRWELLSKKLVGLPPLFPEVLERVLDLAGELIVEPVDVLHCWLDEPNIIGFLAGKLAGIDPIILSLRALSPPRHPHFLLPWMRPCYALAAESSGVTLVANSVAGARDYEQWLGLPTGQVSVVLNTFVPPVPPPAEEVVRFRQTLNLHAEAKVVAGIMRFSPEKRPLVFLDVIARLREKVPALKVLLVGHGAMANDVRDHVRRLDLDNVVQLLGQRRDVPAILSASDILLLTSNSEGLPNVVIEAQHFGCVPIVTDAGGTPEALAPGKSGIVCGIGDVEAMVQAGAAMLSDPTRLADMADAGRAFVARQFDPSRIYQQTMALYARMLNTSMEPAPHAA